MAGVATITASAVAIAPSVQPPPPPTPAPTIQLAADVQPLALRGTTASAHFLLNSPLAAARARSNTRNAAPSAGSALVLPIAPNLADTIDGIYIAVEPWVQYGFEVATAVVRWIPYVGWFAGLIMDGYFFGESLVASGVFNFTDWLRGDGGVVENLVDFGIDVGLAFVWLGIDALDSFIPLPPFCCYPPRPPVQGPFSGFDDALGPDGDAAGSWSHQCRQRPRRCDLRHRCETGSDDGVDVLQAALAPIPLVSIVGDQVNLLYDVLVEPIADSVVFGFDRPRSQRPTEHQQLHQWGRQRRHNHSELTHQHRNRRSQLCLGRWVDSLRRLHDD